MQTPTVTQQPRSATPERAALSRALGLSDVVLLYVATIVGLSSVAQVAQLGLAGITLLALAVGTFLIPSAVMVAELGRRMPAEGGLYLWTRSAFGDLHGFICAWAYYVSNIVWLPTVAMMVATSALYLAGDRATELENSPLYNAGTALAILWAVTLLNVVGIQHAKRVQNAGALATVAIVFLMVFAGGSYIAEKDVLATVQSHDFLPTFSDTSLLGFFALVAFSFGGLELAPILSGEIREPGRTLPRAILMASLVAAAIYGVLILLLVLMSQGGDIHIINGLAAALHGTANALGHPLLATLGALLVVISTLGVFGGWLTGTARIPFAMGIAHYLPDSFARVHPRYRSPHVSLLFQALLLSVLILAAAAGATVKEAFLVLLDMSIILYFLPFLYMFAAFVWHVRRDLHGPGLFPALRRRPTLLWLIAGAGFATTLASLLVSVIPTKDVEDPTAFVVKVIGGAAILIGGGLLVFWAERRRGDTSTG